MLDRLRHREDRTYGYAGCGEQVGPLFGRPRRQRLLDEWQQLITVPDPAGIGGIPVVVDQVVQPDRVREAPPQPVVSDGDHEVTVAGGEPLVGNDIGMC